MTAFLIVAVVVFWIGAALDFYTTKRALVDLRRFGFGERNEAVEWLAGQSGWRTAMVVLKVGVFVAVWFWLGGSGPIRPALLLLAGLAQLYAAHSNRELIQRKRGH